MEPFKVDLAANERLSSQLGAFSRQPAKVRSNCDCLAIIPEFAEPEWCVKGMSAWFLKANLESIYAGEQSGSRKVARYAFHRGCRRTQGSRDSARCAFVSG